MSQSDKILQALQEAGDKGVHMRKLNKIAYRYSARLYDLRRDGYKIGTEQIKRGEFKYILEESNA